MFSDKLVSSVTAVWNEMLEHPFLTGIIDGTLDKKKFTKYMVQDTIYLKEYAKVYAWGIIKTSDVNIMRRLYKDMADVIVADETIMHARYLKNLGYTEADALAVPMEQVTRDYLEFMLKTSETSSFEEGLVSLMPCALSYYYIACCCRERAIAGGTYEGNYYREWFDDLAGDGYKAVYDSSISLCDDLFEHLDDAKKQRLLELFRIGTDYEFDFWRMSWED